MDQLPNKPSALLRIAVDDALKCEADGRYILRMSFWHKPLRGDEGKCSVCMAGAVMAQRLGAKPDEEVEQMPGDFEDVAAHLEAIDHMRVGQFECAAGLLGFDPDEAEETLWRAKRLVADAFDRQTGRAPWSAYLEAAGILEKAGL